MADTKKFFWNTDHKIYLDPNTDHDINFICKQNQSIVWTRETKQSSSTDKSRPVMNATALLLQSLLSRQLPSS